jgi:hypothetical protein
MRRQNEKQRRQGWPNSAACGSLEVSRTYPENVRSPGSIGSHRRPVRTVMLSDELRDQFRHNSSAYGKRIAT